MARRTPDFVERILRELEQRNGALTAAEAAQLARRSKSRMRHVFTPHTGMNFRTARLYARLRRGCELLVHTRMSIPEISAILLYSERSKFEKAFKARYGMTPTQYRNTM